MPATRESARSGAAKHSLRPRHPSHKLTASIYCEIDGLPAEIEPLELSTAGLFVETPTPPLVDSEVEVFLRIGDMRFEASGHVVQTVSCEQAKATRRKPGYGLLFTNVDDAARAHLRHGIQSLVTQRASTPGAQRNAPVPPAAAPQTPSISPNRPAASAAIRGASIPPKQAAIRSPHPPRTSVQIQIKETPSAKPAPAKVDPAERAVLEKLRAELLELDAKTPWAILGVSQGVDPAQIKQAFFAASKRYHPHLYARYAAPEIKQVVTELFIAHKRAYTTMLKTGKTQRNAVIEHSGSNRVKPSKQPGPGNQ